MFNNDAIKLDDETFVRLQYTVLDILKMFKDDDALFRFIRYELSAASIGNDIAKELVEQSGFKSIEYDGALFEDSNNFDNVSTFFDSILQPYLNLNFPPHVAIFLRCKVIKSIIGRNRIMINNKRYLQAQNYLEESPGGRYSVEWKEALDVIYMTSIVQERGIEFLTHFTSIDNLHSIVKSGFLSRSDLENQKIGYTYFDKDRLDSKLDATCFSVTFPNSSMFYSYRNRYINNTWCLILLNASIVHTKECLFYPSNAASSIYRNLHTEQFKGPAALEAMFAEEVNTSRGILKRSTMLKDQDTTDVQAEVMVLEKIEPSYIKHIFVNDDQLAIRLRTLYPNLSIESIENCWGYFDDRNSFRSI